MVNIWAEGQQQMDEIGEEQECIASMRGALAVYEALLLKLIETEASFNPNLKPRISAQLDTFVKSASDGDPGDKWDECYRIGSLSTASRMQEALQLLQEAGGGIPRVN